MSAKELNLIGEEEEEADKLKEANGNIHEHTYSSYLVYDEDSCSCM